MHQGLKPLPTTHVSLIVAKAAYLSNVGPVAQSIVKGRHHSTRINHAPVGAAVRDLRQGGRATSESILIRTWAGPELEFEPRNTNLFSDPLMLSKHPLPRPLLPENSPQNIPFIPAHSYPLCQPHTLPLCTPCPHPKDHQPDIGRRSGAPHRIVLRCGDDARDVRPMPVVVVGGCALTTAAGATGGAP